MLKTVPSEVVDVAIVGGGAAGLATAIFAARRAPGTSIAVLDGARSLGAKILVAGGGRCNVTNRIVTPADYSGGSRNTIRRILSEFPVEETVAFFREIGVDLREEEHGKLFPTTNRARTVLDALLNEADCRGVCVRPAQRVTAIRTTDFGFQIETPAKTFAAGRVVLATGGRSLPKTGSDGGGYALARHLGHALVRTAPALVPLILAGDFHAPLAGIAQDVELAVKPADAKAIRVTGAMLWTHFGASGPAVLDISRHWLRARLVDREVGVHVNFLPGQEFNGVDEMLRTLATSQPKASVSKALSRLLPNRVADAVLVALEIDRSVTAANLPKDQRRKLAHALVDWPLQVTDSRGYAHAEVTAGGVPLSEIDPRTMASRKCPNLFLVGEILDVDGRIGGFNFQWAWSSAFVAGAAIAKPRT